MRRRQFLGIALFLFVVVIGVVFYRFGGPVWRPLYVSLIGGRSVDEAVDQYAADAEPRLRPFFDEVGVAYPPSEAILIAFKEQKRLELWAADSNAEPAWRHIHDYPILAASGNAGPKLREGDRQVPEGVYRIESLNPNSSYHLSMKLDYPNAFDRARAAEDKRDDPGSNIFIHGKAASVGCLAMGDPAIEELFVLAARVGIENIKVVVLPHDPRVRPLLPAGEGLPVWTTQLYEQLQIETAAVLAD